MNAFKKNMLEVQIMKKFKIALPGVLIAALLLISACNSAPSAITNNEPPITEPEIIEPVSPPEIEEPNAPLEPLPEPPDADWETQFDEWPDVIIDGVGVPGSSHRLIGEDDIFPNYVSLVPVAIALGADVYTIDSYPAQVTLEGLNGRIGFAIGSEDFEVDGETITLNLPALEVDGEIYVPILFFRDGCGADSAFFSGGEVHISTAAGDMQ